MGIGHLVLCDGNKRGMEPSRDKLRASGDGPGEGRGSVDALRSEVPGRLVCRKHNSFGSSRITVRVNTFGQENENAPTLGNRR